MVIFKNTALNTTTFTLAGAGIGFGIAHIAKAPKNIKIMAAVGGAVALGIYAYANRAKTIVVTTIPAITAAAPVVITNDESALINQKPPQLTSNTLDLTNKAVMNLTN